MSEQIVAAAGSGTAPHSEAGRLLIRNLVALGILGVGVSFWVLACTDWFPVVGGLLGLGGALAWIAFVGGLLTDERKDQLRVEIERAMLLRPATWKWALGLVLAFGLTISFFGTLELQSIRGEEYRLLQLRDAIAPAVPLDESEIRVLAPLARSRMLVLTGWRPRTYRVRVEGLPFRDVEIGPVFPTRVTVPSSFERRPLALIRADETLTSNAGDPARVYHLVVTIDGKVIGWLPKFPGNTVWVGCHADVMVPERLRQQWQRDYPTAPLAWSVPLAIASETVLEPGRRIEAWLLKRIDGLEVGVLVSSPLFHPDNVTAHGSRNIAQGGERILEVVLIPYN